MKAFLLTFDQSKMTRDAIIGHIDEIEAVENWYTLFEGTVLIASRLTSRQISAFVRDRYPDLKFIIIEIDPEQKAGWLPRSVWSFLNNPQPATESA